MCFLQPRMTLARTLTFCLKLPDQPHDSRPEAILTSEDVPQVPSFSLRFISTLESKHGQVKVFPRCLIMVCPCRRVEGL